MTKAKRILYVGQLWEGGTCLDRMRALRDLSFILTPFDVTPYETTFWPTRVVAHRLNWGPPLRRLNHNLVSFIRKESQFSHVWIDKGIWIWPETLQFLKKETRATLIHYTPDPQLLLHKSRHFKACIPQYDFLFTTKSFELDLYRTWGAKNVFLTSQAYDNYRFCPRTPSAAEQQSLGSDVTFIGHHELHYAHRLRILCQSNVPVRIWGPGWKRYALFRPWARAHVSGDGLWASQYPLALCCAKICLGLLSKRIPESTTTRTFEIPACGAFMLAERTDEHLALFEEGKEAEFFSSDHELLDKVKYYLVHPRERKRIAAAGRERCIKSGYSYHDRLKEVLRVVPSLQEATTVN